MGKAKPITKAGRKRLDAAMNKHGMLLVQGQHELPSIADLLEGLPITTRGYSWDYVPAWDTRWELTQQPDYALVKLFGGMNTVVHRRHWPALNVLAAAARKAVLKSDDGPGRMLKLIESRPGITGEQLKHALKLTGKPGTRAFQRDKTKLEHWLCVEGREQDEEEAGHHTHDNAWFPWAQGKVGNTEGDGSLLEAARTLMTAVYGKNAPAERRTMLKAFPVARFA